MAELPKDGAGVFMTMVSSSANLTEKAMGVPLGVARTLRDELFRTTYAGVDLVEGVNQSSFKAMGAGVEWAQGINQSSFKIVREMIQRLDKMSQEAVDGLELVTGAFSKVIRGSGEATSDMIAQTAEAASTVIARTAASLTRTKQSSSSVAAT